MNFFKSISIKNFFSIKDKLDVDFKATEYTIKQHPDRVVFFNDNYYNKLISFYGPNGSGKTTILKAFVFVASIIDSEGNGNFFPTAYKNIYNRSNANSFIEIDFVIKNVNYVYKIDFLCEEDLIIGIKDETLIVLTDNKKRKLIHRSKKIAKSLNSENIGSLLFDKIPSNKSILKELITRTEDFENITNFFTSICKLTNIKGTHTISMDLSDKHDIFRLAFSLSKTLPLQFENRFSNIINLNKKDRDKVLRLSKDRFSNYLSKIFNSIGIDIKDTNADMEVDIDNSGKDKKFKIEFNMRTTHHFNKNKHLDFNLESSGTKMLYRILYSIYYAKIEKSVAIIDELDSIVHPMVVPIINLLITQNDIQVLYSSQNISNMKYLYKDEIFIVEKNSKHETNIIDLKNKYEGYENFTKLYENNILGGIPDIKNLNLEI